MLARFVVALFFVLSAIQYGSGQELPINIRRSAEEILGTIDPSEVDDCIVRGFADPYPSLNADLKRKEFRWRVRVPDGSRFNVRWAKGVLPDEGFPNSGEAMIAKDNRLPSDTGDVVIVLRATADPTPTLELSIFGEFPQNLPFGIKQPDGKELSVVPDRKNAVYIDTVVVRDATWLPYWQNKLPTLEGLDQAKSHRLQPKGEHLLMKHYVEREGKLRGYAVWLEFEE